MEEVIPDYHAFYMIGHGRSSARMSGKYGGDEMPKHTLKITRARR